MARTSYLLMR